MKQTKILLSVFLFLLSCQTTEQSPEYGYRHSTHQNNFAEDDAWVTTCSMAGPESHVVIATLVSSTWEKRVCGEELPESRFRYLIDVSTPILDAKKGRMELLGQQHFEWLPKSAQPGDKFLIAYRTERGHNFLLQWVEMLEGEVNVEERQATLPSNFGKLVAAIQQQRRSKCTTKYNGFTSPFDSFIRPWSHRVCGGSVDPIQEPPISNGVDL